MAVLLFCVALPGLVQAELQVTNEKRNILSQRIAGKWIQNKSLSRELWGKAELAEKEMLIIELTSDKGALQKFPNKIRDLIAKEGSKVYFAGWISFGDKHYPCLLRKSHGNTCLTFLDDTGLDSINVMMAVGAVSKVDQLFVGGRYTSEGTLPFYAYRRQTEEAESGPGE